MEESDLYKGERLDDTGFGLLRIIQSPDEFCYGVDAVLLSDFADCKEGSKVIDLGTGNGIIPLILSYKTKAKEIWGLELQENAYSRAVRSISFNGLSSRIHMQNGDVKEINQYFQAETFDAVTINPPYVAQGGGLLNENNNRRTARHETTASLFDFLNAASTLLRNRGDLYLIHRPSRLVDLFYHCRSLNLEPKRIRLVSPRRGKEPNLVLIHCVKNGGAELKLLNPLYIYRKDGRYTKELLQIYGRQK